MALGHTQYVSRPLLQGVKNYLESTFQGDINCLEEKMQKQWKDLLFKVEALEEELGSSRDEVGNLRLALIMEQKRRQDEEERNRKLTEIIEELKTEVVRLEEKMVEFEETPTVPPPSDNGVLTMLNELVNDTGSNFKELNGSQTKLEEEGEGMTKVLQQPTASAPSPLPPAPPVSSVVVYYFPPRVPEKRPNPSPGLGTSEISSSFPVLSPAHSPPQPPPEEVEVMLNGNPSHSTSPNPEQLTFYADEPEHNSVATSGLNHGSRWDQEHGKDPGNPSGKSCLCGSSFNSKDGLQKHIFYFTQEWKFPCKLCPMRFHAHTLLRKHLRAAHGVMAKQGEEKTFGCRQCGALLETWRQCTTHLRVVHGKGKRLRRPSSTSLVAEQLEKSIKSLGFGWVGAQKSSSQSMMPPRRRGGPRSATRHGIDHARHLHCLCGRTFAEGVTLMNHVNYHTMKTFLCKVCDKRFSYKCHLKIHLTKVHKFPMTVQEAGASGVIHE